MTPSIWVITHDGACKYVYTCRKRGLRSFFRENIPTQYSKYIIQCNVWNGYDHCKYVQSSFTDYSHSGAKGIRNQQLYVVAKQKLQCATLQLCILISNQINGNSHIEQQKQMKPLLEQGRRRICPNPLYHSFIVMWQRNVFESFIS